MPLIAQKKGLTFFIGVWHLTESLEELESHPYASSYVEQSKQFKSINRRMEWLATRALLHSMLGRKVNIEYNQLGKPWLLDRSNYIGISHSKDYVAIIISPTNKVSIDIETPPYHKIQTVAPRVFSDKESFYSPDKWWLYAPLIWCAKETLYKLLDQGGIDFKKQLSILPFDIQGNVGSFTSQVSIGDSSFLQEIHYIVHDEYIMTYTIQ